MRALHDQAARSDPHEGKLAIFLVAVVGVTLLILAIGRALARYEGAGR